MPPQGKPSSPRLDNPYEISYSPALLEPPPYTNKELILRYIKGFFEGDGYLSWHNVNQQWSFGFTSNEKILLWIRKCLLKYNIVNSLTVPKKIEHGINYHMVVKTI